ncbi:MAG: hypothetical protein R6U37_04425 [Dehalococcoidia bacterium]
MPPITLPLDSGFPDRVEDKLGRNDMKGNEFRIRNGPFPRGTVGTSRKIPLSLPLPKGELKTED